MDLTYKELMEQQKAVRTRVLSIMTKENKSILAMAKDMELSPTTLRRWLIKEEDVIFRVFTQILNYCQKKESEKVTEDLKNQKQIK